MYLHQLTSYSTALSSSLRPPLIPFAPPSHCLSPQGYALVEYETYREADDAISGMNNTNILGKTVEVDWSFVKPPVSGRFRRGRK